MITLNCQREKKIKYIRLKVCRSSYITAFNSYQKESHLMCNNAKFCWRTSYPAALPAHISELDTLSRWSFIWWLMNYNVKLDCCWDVIRSYFSVRSSAESPTQTQQVTLHLCQIGFSVPYWVNMRGYRLPQLKSRKWLHHFHNPSNFTVAAAATHLPAKEVQLVMLSFCA